MGFVLSLAYVLKADYKRLLMINSFVLAASVLMLASTFMFYEDADRLSAFLANCAGIFIYFVLVSLITLIVGWVRRSTVMISSGITGLALCLVLFMVLSYMWPESR
jgi:hypothetical protein